MYKSKLLKTFQLFSEAELDRFALFLQSPYLVNPKSHKEGIRLFDYLRPFYPDFDSIALEKKTIFQHLYQDKLYVPRSLEKVSTSLLKLIGIFIRYEYAHIEQENVSSQLIKARFLKEKQLDKQFRTALLQIRQQQTNNPYRNRHYYFDRFQIEQELSEYESFHNKREDDLNLSNTLRSLDIFYISSKLEYACLLLEQKRLRRLSEPEESLLLLDKMLGYIQGNSYLREPIIEVYEQAFYLLLKNRNHEAFSRLQQLLQQHAQLIPFDQLRGLYSMSRNFCVTQYNLGEKSYLPILFDLYKKHLKGGFLYYDEGILPSTIKNVVSVGLQLQEYDWVYQLLNDHADKIVATNFPREVYNFNLANYYFYTAAYEEALTLLADKYEDAYYKIAAKRLELKIFYEQQSVLLESKIQAFKVYIFRISKKILPDLPRKGNNYFIDILRQINSTKTYRNPKRIQKLIKKIETIKAIPEKEWLLEKLADLS